MILIRNCYGHPRTVDGKIGIYQPWGERFPLEALVTWMDEVQRISGRMKYLMANEIGHPNREGWEVQTLFHLFAPSRRTSEDAFSYIGGRTAFQGGTRRSVRRSQK